MNNKKLIILSSIISIFLIGSAVVFSNLDKNNTYYGDSLNIQNTAVNKSKANIGKLDSSHDHVSMLVFINGEMLDLSQDKYMLKDQFVHLEDGDGVVVHRHATGVTLPYFFSTIGISLTQNCITLDTGRQYCDSPSKGKKLLVLVNGEEIDDVTTYEPQHKDKILINYGDDSDVELQFKFNNIPDVPKQLL